MARSNKVLPQGLTEVLLIHFRLFLYRLVINHKMNETITHVIIVLITVSIVLILFYIMIDERDRCTYHNTNIGETTSRSKDTTSEDVLEHYDLELPNISPTECGTQCTEGINCAGFAYKPIEKKCYLSKTAILGEPMESLYSDQYSKLDRRCNKINRITDAKRIDGNSLTENSIYVCSDGENNTATEFQYANLGASALDGTKTTIYDTADKDKLVPENVKYEVHDITWPTTKIDSNAIAAQPYVNMLSSGTSSKQFGFVESDKEFLGQYALAHQCVVNVPFFDCLKYCENDPNCAGTEWNKSMIKQSAKGDYNYLYENVCCPKSVIKKIIPRRKEFDRGRFYVKKNLMDILQRDKVVLTKADFSQSAVPINKRFDLKVTDFDTADVNDPKQQPIEVEGVTDPVYEYK